MLRIVRPVADWMSRYSAALFEGSSETPMERLWTAVVAALDADQSDSPSRMKKNWVEEAYKDAAGLLSRALLHHPACARPDQKSGLDPDWKLKMEGLLKIEGDQGLSALAIASANLSFFWNLDREWTTASLVPAMFATTDASHAFWDGFLWGNRVPPKALFRKMLPEMIKILSSGKLQKPAVDSLADILLFGWLKWRNLKTPVVSDEMMREAIVQGGAPFGSQVLFNVKRRLAKGALSNEDLLWFSQKVWPLQKSLMCSEITRPLTDLLFESGPVFPELFKVMRTRLVPLENFDFYRLKLSGPDGVIEQYPVEMLDLLERLLPQDPRFWPHFTWDVLARLAKTDALQDNVRLKRLNRALGR